MTQELYGVISLGGTVIGGSLNQRGLKGEDGNGISSITMDENYDLVIDYTQIPTATVDTGLDGYASLLDGYKDDAVSAKNDAVSAKNDAVSAKNDAVSAKSDAQSAKSDAVSAKNDAVSAKTDAQSAKTAAETAQGKAENSALDSEAYAVGTRNGSAVTSGDVAYENNSKYMKEQAAVYTLQADSYAGESELWATGELDGTPVGNTYPQYHNNSKYYAGQASSSATSASGSATSAGTDALKAEGYAVGKQNGTDVSSGSPYYENNAKYYADEASDSATAAAASAASIPSASVTDPEMDGTASAGSANSFARGDHVHPTDTNIVDMVRKALPTDTASGAIASFPDGSDLFDYLSCVVNIEPVQAGSGTPSPDNVRPITGWTGCEVDVCGVNLFDGEFNTLYKLPQHLSANTFMTASCASASNTQIRYYDIEGNQIDYWTLGSQEGNRYYKSFKLNSDSYYVKFTNNNLTPTDMQIEVAESETSLPSPYESPTTYPVSWQTEAGTVYGGTVDVVSGVLTVDSALIDLGSLEWTYATLSSVGIFYANLNGGSQASTFNGLCSGYPIVASLHAGDDKVAYLYGSTQYGFSRIAIANSDYGTDANAFKVSLDGVQLVYELATPQTYQLTPTQIQCLLGQNNVWANCGDTSVTYKADVQRWVKKKLDEVNTAILALA